MSPKLKCHQNWNVTKTKMSLKLKFYKKFIVTKAKILSKILCHQCWNVHKTEMLPNIKMSSKSKSKSKRSALITLVLFYIIYAMNLGRISCYDPPITILLNLFWHLKKYIKWRRKNKVTYLPNCEKRASFLVLTVKRASS